MDAQPKGHFIALELVPKDDDLRRHLTSVRVLMNVDVPCVTKLSMIDADGDRKQLAHLLSLGAAVAAERYLRLRNPDDVLFSDEITDFEN